MGSQPKVPKPAYVPPPMQPSPTAKIAANDAASPLPLQSNAGTILTSPLGSLSPGNVTQKTLTGQ